MMDEPTPPNPNDEGPEPLWLPKGSVRAIIALAIVGIPYGRIAMGLPVDADVLDAALAGALAYGALRALPTRSR